MTDRILLLTVTIPGNPKPAPRAGRQGNRSWMPKDYLDYREAIAYGMLLRRGSHRPDRTSAFVVSCVFFRDSARDTDVDNLAKSCLDAGQNVLWRNDSQVVELHVRKDIDRDNPRTWIRVWLLGVAQENLENLEAAVAAGGA